jgi:peptidyl-prolyl cis-trans isomerase D
MATLERIRNKAGLLIAVIGVALFAFIIGDFLNSGTTLFGNSRDKVGNVDGVELSINEFQKQVSLISNMGRMSGYSYTDGQIRDIVWTTFVNETLLNSEAEKTGLAVTAQELKDKMFGPNFHPLMYQTPLFRNEQNVFDPNRVLAIYSQMDQPGNEAIKEQWLYIEKNIKEQILAEKYLSLVSKSIAPTKADRELSANLDKEIVDFAYIRQPYFSIPDSSVSVTKKEIETKYNETKEDYKTDGYRTVQAIVFDIIPSAVDSVKTLERTTEVRKRLKSMSTEEIYAAAPQLTSAEMPVDFSFKSENEVDPLFRTFAFAASSDSVSEIVLSAGAYKMAKVVSPIQQVSDSVKISHIVIQRANEAEAMRIADSLKTALNNGDDFAALAQKFSIDKNTASQGGDMGWFTEKFMGELADRLLFGVKGDILVNTLSPEQGMVQVLKITDKTAPKSKVRLAIISNKIEPSNTTYRNVYAKANQFIVNNKTLESFQNAANEQGLQIRSLPQLSRNQSDVYVLEQARPIIKWAWENDKGAVSSEVYTVSQNQYAVAAVSEAVEPGYIPLKDISENVKTVLIKEKKGEIIKEKLKGVADLSAYPPVDTLRNIRFSQSTLTNIGRAPLVTAEATLTPVNQISEPVDAGMAIYLLKVLDKREAAPVDLNNDGARMQAEIKAGVERGLFESLKKNADIEDNRYFFY